VFVKRERAMLWLIGGAAFAVVLVKAIATYAQDSLVAYVGQRIIADLQSRLFGRIVRQDMALFQSRHSGTLVSLFTYDVNTLRNAVTDAVIAIGRDGLSVVFLLGVTFYEDWLLATLSLVIAPLAVFPIQRLSMRMRRASTEVQEQMGALNTALAQGFQGIRVIKAFALEEVEEGRIRLLVNSLARLSVRVARTQAAAQPIIDGFGGIAVTAVIVIGGSRVIDGATTPGAFFSFVGAMLMVYQPLRSLSKVTVSLQQGLSAAERLFTMMDRERLLVDAPDARPLPRIAGAVCFDAVRFSYDGDHAALDGVAFEAAAGGVTALVGPSGAGKSTVFNLIPRFYDPDSGRVIVNGMDVRTATLASLRDAMAMVTQEVMLFDDTILANIRCGRLSATREEAMAAARAAAAAEFIETMRDGYETRVGEHGARLSGGQRQRIAIARALLKDAPILLLDEATSALDTESERKIQAALATLMRGRTTIVVAHRLSTIVNADLIHVFERGRVRESGSHAELLAKGGIYARLYDMQFASAPEERPVETAIAP
jgi:subfamily B ATP-binding cassette protein MsbA